MAHITYFTKGTCSSQIDITTNDNEEIERVVFYGGCNGNLKGISSLVKGMKVKDVIKKLEGTTCGFKSTSCPDQLAKALKQLL
ncbi:MAG: TIGR03905 family TSCPD domain-containing protein [Sodaliphilus sp.]